MPTDSTALPWQPIKMQHHPLTLQNQGNLLRGLWHVSQLRCLSLPGLAPFWFEFFFFFFHLLITPESSASTYMPFLMHLVLSKETHLSIGQGLEGNLGTKWLIFLPCSSFRGRHRSSSALELLNLTVVPCSMANIMHSIGICERNTNCTVLGTEEDRTFS